MTNFTFHIPANAVVVGLCAGRHDMPVDEFIFPQEVEPTDFRAMSRTVDAFLDNRVGTHLRHLLAPFPLCRPVVPFSVALLRCIPLPLARAKNSRRILAHFLWQ